MFGGKADIRQSVGACRGIFKLRMFIYRTYYAHDFIPYYSGRSLPLLPVLTNEPHMGNMASRVTAFWFAVHDRPFGRSLGAVSFCLLFTVEFIHLLLHGVEHREHGGSAFVQPLRRLHGV